MSTLASTPGGEGLLPPLRSLFKRAAVSASPVLSPYQGLPTSELLTKAGWTESGWPGPRTGTIKLTSSRQGSDVGGAWTVACLPTVPHGAGSSVAPCLSTLPEGSELQHLVSQD